MARICFFLLILALNLKVFAQHNDFQAGTYNVLSGVVIGGIGAALNKSPDETWGRTLLRGTSQGALGGYLNFESKKMVRSYYRNGYSGSIWPSRILNEVGNSIIHNGASNRKIGATWQFNIGFGHFGYDRARERRFRARIMPFAFTSAVHGFLVGRFDPANSLRYASLVFKRRRPLYNEEAYGYASLNTIVYRDQPEVIAVLDNVLAHEYMHTLQYAGYRGMNAFVKPLKKDGPPNFYTKVFDTDYNAIPYSTENLMLDLFNVDQFDRYTEKEIFYYVPNEL